MENTSDPLVPAYNPGPLTGPGGNNTWFLDGAMPTLIDAGVGVREHIAAIDAVLGGRPLAQVLVTHGHHDHASGVPALRARWPHLQARKWPADDGPGWRRLEDGQEIHAGDITLRVLHTPGHAQDHVCFWNGSRRHLYTGDMLVKDTTVMIPTAARGGSVRDYLASLERLAALGPERAFPGHGPVIDRPLDLIAQYLEHRRMRERQVLGCLDDGLTDVDAMVARIYPDVAPQLRAAARMTIEAHLEKLKEEGRA